MYYKNWSKILLRIMCCYCAVFFFVTSALMLFGLIVGWDHNMIGTLAGFSAAFFFATCALAPWL